MLDTDPFILQETLIMCGVFGVRGTEHAARLTVPGLQSLQHRGQEACGITVFEDGEGFHTVRKHGLADFTEEEIALIPGTSSVGHVRYSTSGKKKRSLWRVQPFFKRTMFGGVAIAHNGNFVNADELREEVLRNGATLQTAVDTEILFPLITLQMEGGFRDRLAGALSRVRGAYSLIVLTEREIIGVRDPFGFRPLVLGTCSGASVLASETCALEKVGARFDRSLLPGEMLSIGKEGIRSEFPFSSGRPARRCIFEHVYFSAPQSVFDGLNMYDVRKKIGARLAEESPVAADAVVPIPDSGTPAAIGYAQESGIPFELGIVRNQYYKGRTFILPTDSARRDGVKEKHLPNGSVLKGKRIILVDDSIVRGNTLVDIVKMVRECGAVEVHVRIASPPITHPCLYGIDTPERSKLLAARMNVEAMKAFLNADSLAFVSIAGLRSAVGEANPDDPLTGFCTACFTGAYPEK